ncbi:MAG TPA: hypothetical protein VFZ66_20185 [Herpetosiphonaceae bacterium]
MQRNEKLMVIHDVPAAIVDALDGVMAAQGLVRVVVREIEEDFTPLLNEPGGPLIFVLSQPQNDWTACFSSLEPDAEWQLIEALSVALEQPAVYALFSDTTSVYAYRYFENGVLHEEYTPDEGERFSADMLLERLANHGISLDLIDDRTLNFGAEHILVGYSGEEQGNKGTREQ